MSEFCAKIAHQLQFSTLKLQVQTHLTFSADKEKPRRLSSDLLAN